MTSPYDMIEATISTGKGVMPILLRPYRFDSEPVNLDTLKNAFGNVIRPTQLSSSCPNCGVMVDVAFNIDMKYKCEECYVAPKIKYISAFVEDPISPIRDLIYTPIEESIDTEDDNLTNLLDHLGGNADSSSSE